MVIVELIDAHDGFEIITERIQTTSKRKLVWIVGIIAFFLSAVLDNLTTTIVMVSLLRKFIPSHKDRLMFAGLVVISANAGGAWSPIGDVTTTMLWIGNQITTANIIIKTITPFIGLFFCSCICYQYANERFIGIDANKKRKTIFNRNERKTVFIIGIACLLFVPFLKPLLICRLIWVLYLGLGLMWVLTEMVHSGKDEQEKGLLSVNHALTKN